MKRGPIACIALLLSVTAASAQNANVASTPESPSRSVVRGRVYYADSGRPVRRASLYLLSEGKGHREVIGLTDNEGNFQIKDVEAGVYYPMINAPGVVTPLGLADFSNIKDNEEKAFADAFAQFQRITVNGSNDIEVQIPAVRGGAVGGRVTFADGDPAVGVKVEILRKAGDTFMPVIPNFGSMFGMMLGNAFQTDDRGVYRFSGLPRGEYKIKVTENVRHSDNRRNSREDEFMALFGGAGSFVSIYYPDILDADRAGIVNVELGAEMSEVNIVIPNRDLHRVDGKVVAGRDKTAVKGATVYIRRKGDNDRSLFKELGMGQQVSVTDDEGKWAFREVPKGDYDIVVEPQSVFTAPMLQMAANSNANISVPAGKPQPKYAKKIQELTIDEKDMTDLVVELGSGARLSGVVEVKNGREIPRGVKVTAINDGDLAASTGSLRDDLFGGGDPEAVSTVRNAQNNTFNLENVATGKTYLRIEVSEPDLYLIGATADGRDLLAAPFELKDGDIIANIHVLLGKDVGTISGSVVNGDKDPVRHAQFTLVPTDAAKRKNSSFYRSVAADDNGEFKVSVGPGEYAILFNFVRRSTAKNGADYDKWLDDGVHDARKITVEPNDTTTLKLVVPKQ